MKNLGDAMKAFFYFLVFTMLAASQLYADICDDAVLEFEEKTQDFSNKRMIVYDHMKAYAQHFSEMNKQIAGQSCAANAIERTSANRQIIKEKRIETIAKYIKLGIKEEGGKNILFEYEYLTGKNKKFTYDFEDVFNKSAEKISVVAKAPIVASGKCSDTIIQNDMVNLQNVRNQDSVGWCYAFTASDLLSFKLGKRISAVSLYSSGQDIESDILSKTSANGGDIKSSIDDYLAKKGGLCLEEDLPSNDFKFCINQKYNDFLNKLLNVVREKRLDQEISENNCFGSDLESAFPGVNLSLIKNHTNKFGTKKLVEFLYDQQCKKISFKGIKLKVVVQNSSRFQKDVLMKSLDESISRGEPAGIGYDYNKINSEAGEGGHASLVVGRRTNPETGTCEYLVRNSWGKNCEQKEGPDLTCHKNCDGSGCRYSGHFWVSSSKLQDSILGVTTVNEGK